MTIITSFLYPCVITLPSPPPSIYRDTVSCGHYDSIFQFSYFLWSIFPTLERMVIHTLISVPIKKQLYPWQNLHLFSCHMSELLQLITMRYHSTSQIQSAKYSSQNYREWDQHFQEWGIQSSCLNGQRDQTQYGTYKSTKLKFVVSYWAKKAESDGKLTKRRKLEK